MVDNEVQFSTSRLTDTDLLLINVLLTQSKHDTQAVVRACEFVLKKLVPSTEKGDSK